MTLTPPCESHPVIHTRFTPPMSDPFTGIHIQFPQHSQAFTLQSGIRFTGGGVSSRDTPPVNPPGSDSPADTCQTSVEATMPDPISAHPDPFGLLPHVTAVLHRLARLDRTLSHTGRDADPERHTDAGSRPTTRPTLSPTTRPPTRPTPRPPTLSPTSRRNPLVSARIPARRTASPSASRAARVVTQAVATHSVLCPDGAGAVGTVQKGA
jgi:hypothetical protein